jgi:hypothetical protein
MSFGFSIGDFLAVGKLIVEIQSSLSDTQGSKSEYQELVRELEALQSVLRHLDKLQQSNAPSPTLDSIKYAALSCQRPLEDFLGRIAEYDKSLGIWEKKNAFSKTADKLRWTFRQKDDIRKLQSYLNVHVGTINMLLAEHGLEKMDLVSNKIESNNFEVRQKLDSTQCILQIVKDGVSAQALIVQNTQSMLSRLFQMVSGEIMTPWSSLGEMVAKVWYVGLFVKSILFEVLILHPETNDQHVASQLSKSTVLYLK